MGGGSFTSKDWTDYTTTRTAGKSTAHVFSSRHMDPEFDPSKIKLRESRDGADNPVTTAIWLGLDVTGSMHTIPDHMAREGLRPLYEEIYERLPVPGPHIGTMAIGDPACDQAPLQVTQLEADIRSADQLTRLWLEGRGGANDSEGYSLPWWFAGMRTSIDCFEKRGKKGYLFTLGDEEPPATVSPRDMERVFGPGQYDPLTPEAALQLASRQYHVFHLLVAQGHYCAHNPARVLANWQKLMGQRALLLPDFTKLSQVIVSTIQIVEGADKAAVAASWKDSKTRDVVVAATAGIGTAVTRPGAPGSGVVRF